MIKENYMISWLIIKLCSYEYKKQKKNNSLFTIFYIKGTGKDYPKSLLYTEVERVAKQMDNI
jgi:hypothetical protein